MAFIISGRSLTTHNMRREGETLLMPVSYRGLLMKGSLAVAFALLSWSGDGAHAQQGKSKTVWSITWSGPGCKFRENTYTRPLVIGADGTARWRTPAPYDREPVQFTGAFAGKSGSGTFTRLDGKCHGTFVAKRLS